MGQQVAAWLASETGWAVSDVRPAGGGHGARHYRATLADGRELFVKEAAGRAAADAEAGGAGWAPADAEAASGFGRAALDAEAHGLRWLAEAGQVLVPEVVAASSGLLAIDWVPPGTGPDRAAADRFGRELAMLHLAGADGFGAPWPGFIASLPLPDSPSVSWPSWYAQSRLLPYCRIGRDRGVLGRDEVALIEAVAARLAGASAGGDGPGFDGFDEPPRRIHGDLWSGNLLWSGGRGWLIDPAAHGGHRESDLAMLALFGAPQLDRILAAYREVAPLADGWQERVPLHQLHPLLVHVCLFGDSYRAPALAAARSALSALPA